MPSKTFVLPALVACGLLACVSDSMPKEPVTKPTDPCLAAKHDALLACCDGSSSGKAEVPVDKSLQTRSLEDCATGETYTVDCLPASLAKPSESSSEEAVCGTAPQCNESAACAGALEAAHQACGLPSGAQVDVGSCPGELAAQTAVMICEDLEALAKRGCRGVLEGGCREKQGLSPLLRDQCFGAELESSTQALGSGLGGANPNSKPFSSPTGSQDPGTTPKLPDYPQAAGIPRKDFNRPSWLPTRIEIPGSFLRFFLANAALRSLIADFQDRMTASGQTGVSCDPDKLRCDISILGSVDILKVISSANHSDLKITVSYQDGPRIRGINLVTRNDSGDPIAEIDWNGVIRIKETAGPVLDFRNRAYLQLLPLHDPETLSRDASGAPYAAQLSKLDGDANYLDRTWLITGLTGDECTQLTTMRFRFDDSQRLVVGTAEDFGGYPASGSYITYLQPYKCSCGVTSKGSDRQPGNYCVADPYPRPVMVFRNDGRGPILGPPSAPTGLIDLLLADQTPYDPDLTEAAVNGLGAKVHTVFCNSFSQGSVGGPQALRGAVQETGHFTFESNLDQHLAGEGVPGFQISNALLDVRDFGCNGQVANRLPLSQVVPMGHSASLARRVSSGSGYRLGMSVPLGRLEAHLEEFGTLRVDLRFFDSAAEWIKKKLGKYVGFVFKIYFKLLKYIYSAFLTLVANVALQVVGPDTATVDLGTQSLQVDGLLGHRMDVEPQRVEVGVRRVRTEMPNPRVDLFQISWIDESCKGLVADNPVAEKLKRLISCPLEQLRNVVRAVAAPVVRFLAQDVTGFLGRVNGQVASSLSAEILNNTARLEQDNNVAAMAQSMTRSVVLQPYYLAPGEQYLPAALEALGLAAGSSEAKQLAELASRFPGGLSTVCLLAADAPFACLLIELMSGQGQFTDPAYQWNRGAWVMRMGSKTHYRSLGEYGPQPQIDWHYPPVRFCVPGDRPPGTPAYAFKEPNDDPFLMPAFLFGANNHLFRLADFAEIDRTPTGAAADTDWRTQCATFADLFLRSHLWVPVATTLNPQPPLDARSSAAAYQVPASPLASNPATPYPHRDPPSDPVGVIERVEEIPPGMTYIDYGLLPATATIGPVTILRGFELILVPSYRTQLLINEVFVCEDDAACDPTRSSNLDDLLGCAGDSGCDVLAEAATAPIDRSTIRYRAELATCSLLFDLWWRDCGDAQQCDALTTDFRNVGENVGVALGFLEAAASQVCTEPACQGQLQSVQHADALIRRCEALLEGEGWQVPATLDPKEIPDFYK